MTSIEFLKQEYIKRGDSLPSGVFQEAKEMHKQEIIDAWENAPTYLEDKKGEDYYTETFVSKGSDELEQVVNDYDDDPTWIDDEVEVPKQDVDKLGNEDVPKLGYVEVWDKDEPKDDVRKVVEDNVEKLQQDAWDNYEHEEGNLYSTTFRNAFKLGYNKAKETLLSEKRDIEYLKRESYRQGFLEAKETLYTKEQVREAMNELIWAILRNQSVLHDSNYVIESIIQSLKQPKKD